MSQAVTTAAAMPQTKDAGLDVLLVLTHQLHLRNFVASGLLDRLIENGLRIGVVAPRALLPDISEASNRIEAAALFELPPLGARRRRLLGWLRLGSMVARRHRIEYRKRIEWTRRASIGKAAAVAFWLAIGRIWEPEQKASDWVRRLRPSRKARKLWDALQPSLVFWPTIIGEVAGFDIVKSARDVGIPIMMAEGSWDNFTSKGAIWPRPDRVMVWGEYSRKQARAHHRFHDDDIIVTGPPHFDIYGAPDALMTREEWFARHGLDPARRLILFGGTTVGKFTEEAYLIRLISEWIESGQIPSAYVWYRPHPRARNRAQQEGIADMPHIVVDPGVPEDANRAGLVWSLHPDDAIQRANAINTCDMVVSAFSTIVIEAALLGKPSVLVGFGRRDASSSTVIFPSLEFSHVRYLLRCPWITAAHDETELLDQIRCDFDAGHARRRELRDFGLTIANCGDGLGQKRIVEAIEGFAHGARSGTKPAAEDAA